MRNFLIPLMILLIAALPAAAAISKELENWAKGPVQHLMTKDELRAWRAVRTDEEARAFIDLFWTKRDPSPATPENEFKKEFEDRVALADERFPEGKTRGAMTDRGKTLVLLGVPSRISRRTESMAASGPDPAPIEGQQQTKRVTEVWIYESDRVPVFLKLENFELTFRDDLSSGRFRAARAPFNLNEAMNDAAEAAVKHPNLTEVPDYTTTPPAAAAQVVEVSVPAASITAPTEFKTASLRAAFTDFKAAKTSPDKDVFVTYGEFVTSTGDYFVPVQLYLSKNPIQGKTLATVETPAGQTTAVIKEAPEMQPVTFFGVVEDAEGKIVAVYEEPVTLQPSKNEFFADRSLVLAPGKYTGTFGIANQGKPLAMASTEMNLTGVTQDLTSISRLILSNNIFALPEAQQPTDPFAFGGIKVVPKGSLTFTRQDELWYFFELRNPGLAESIVPATTTVTQSSGSTSTSVSVPTAVAGPPTPKIQVKIDVEGTVNGKKVKMGAPLQEAAAEPLRGVPGHFGVGSSIPLAGFSPGDYVIKVKVIDTVKKQTYNLEEKFKITG